MCDKGIVFVVVVDPMCKQQSNLKKTQENTGIGKDLQVKTQKAQTIKGKLINYPSSKFKCTSHKKALSKNRQQIRKKICEQPYLDGWIDRQIDK